MTCRKASVAGVKLYQGEYAQAVLTGDQSDIIIGFVLTHDNPEIWKEKLLHYDGIEKFSEDDYENSWYKRDTVKAVIESDSVEVQAYIYHFPQSEKKLEVPENDWLKRINRK